MHLISDWSIGWSGNVMLCSDGVSVYLLKGAQFHGYVG
jgi:hypothetical protein